VNALVQLIVNVDRQTDRRTPGGTVRASSDIRPFVQVSNGR